MTYFPILIYNVAQKQFRICNNPIDIPHGESIRIIKYEATENDLAMARQCFKLGEGR